MEKNVAKHPNFGLYLSKAQCCEHVFVFINLGINHNLSRSEFRVSPTRGGVWCCSRKQRNWKKNPINAGCSNANPGFIFRFLFSTLII